jgi:hypothetical protein
MDHSSPWPLQQPVGGFIFGVDICLCYRKELLKYLKKNFLSSRKTYTYHTSDNGGYSGSTHETQGMLGDSVVPWKDTVFFFMSGLI